MYPVSLTYTTDTAVGLAQSICSACVMHGALKTRLDEFTRISSKL